VLVWMLRPNFEVLTPDVYIVLENAILPVQQNDEHGCKLVVGWVQSAWRLYIAEPSPETTMMGRSGIAILNVWVANS
jgi:hypothetical protein